MTNPSGVLSRLRTPNSARRSRKAETVWRCQSHARASCETVTVSGEGTSSVPCDASLVAAIMRRERNASNLLSLN